MSILTLLLTFGLALLVALNWHSVKQIEGYGYFGGFIVSALGGGTVLVPIPMSAVQFALGGVLTPWFGPLFLTPLCVGLVCSLGETLGSMTIYAAGYNGASPLLERKTDRPPGRLQRLYTWLTGLMQRRGTLVMFVLSAVMNPFFFPTALACGAIRMGYRKFFLIVLSGKFIKCTLIAYAGYFALGGLLHAFGLHV